MLVVILREGSGPNRRVTERNGNITPENKFNPVADPNNLCVSVDVSSKA